MELADDLRLILVEQGNMNIFFDGTCQPLQQRVVAVRFGDQATAENRFETQHRILLREGWPPKSARFDIYCLLPNTRDARKRMLVSSGYWKLDSLNKDINKALEDSQVQSTHAGTARFALAYGENIVSFPDVQGTLYLVWAKCLTTYNASNVAVKLERDVPLLVNMNGEASIRGIYVLRKEAGNRSLPIVSQGNSNVPTPILIGSHAHLWVYEKRPEVPTLSKVIRTMRAQDAETFATSPSRNTMQWLELNDSGNTNGLQDIASLDAEDEEMAGGGPEAVMVREPPWRNTPSGLFVSREPHGVFLVPGGTADSDQSVEVDLGTEEEAPDPFAELE